MAEACLFACKACGQSKGGGPGDGALSDLGSDDPFAAPDAGGFWRTIEGTFDTGTSTPGLSISGTSEAEARCRHSSTADIGRETIKSDLVHRKWHR